MIGGLKPYPEYKESGVPWLGRIPAHWDISLTRVHISCLTAFRTLKTLDISQL